MKKNQTLHKFIAKAILENNSTAHFPKRTHNNSHKILSYLGRYQGLLRHQSFRHRSLGRTKNTRLLFEPLKGLTQYQLISQIFLH